MKKYILVSVIALISGAAGAHDLTQPIKALNGDNIPICAPDKPECGKTMTVADAAQFALLNAPGDNQVKGDEKMRRFLLATKIQANPHVILTADEVKLIKDAVGVSFGPLVVGRVNQAIDPGEAARK